MRRRAGTRALLACAVVAGLAASVALARPAAAATDHDHGLGLDVGFGFLVASVASGAIGTALDVALPWEALAACVTKSHVRDPSTGDPEAGVHVFELAIEKGRVVVKVEKAAVPATKKGCVARALSRVTVAGTETSLRTPALAIAVVPRLRLAGSGRSAWIVGGTGAAGGDPALREVLRGHVLRCLADYELPGAAGLTGLVRISVRVSEASTARVEGVTGKLATKRVLECLKSRRVLAPSGTAWAVAIGTRATIDVRVLVGLALITDDPAHLKHVAKMYAPAPPSDAVVPADVLAGFMAPGGSEAAVEWKVVAGPATAVGGLTDADVRPIVRAHLAEVRECFAAELTKEPKKYALKLQVEFLVAPSGEVSSVSVLGPASSGGAIGECVVAAARRWAFPPRGSGGAVRVLQTFLLESVLL